MVWGPKFWFKLNFLHFFRMVGGGKPLKVPIKRTVTYFAAAAAGAAAVVVVVYVGKG